MWHNCYVGTVRRCKYSACCAAASGSLGATRHGSAARCATAPPAAPPDSVSPSFPFLSFASRHLAVKGWARSRSRVGVVSVVDLPALVWMGLWRIWSFGPQVVPLLYYLPCRSQCWVLCFVNDFSAIGLNLLATLNADELNGKPDCILYLLIATVQHLCFCLLPK